MFKIIRKLFSSQGASKAGHRGDKTPNAEPTVTVSQSGNKKPPEHPRKAELKRIAKDFGRTEQNCPYCRTPLPKFPQRKTVCKSCQKPIYSRKEPLSGQKRLFRDSELDTWEELNELKMGTWEWWNSGRQKMLSAKEELASEWGKHLSEISDSDAKWRLHTRAWEGALAKGDWTQYRLAKVEAIRQLVMESRLRDAAQMAPECIYLAYVDTHGTAETHEASASDALREFEAKLSELGKHIYGPELHLYVAAFETIDRAKTSFFADQQVSNLVAHFALPAVDAWQRFENDWLEYEAALKGR